MSRKFERIAAWLLLYLWSVPVVLLVQNRMAWQYDGDWEFWLATIWSWPAWAVSEALRSFVSDGEALMAACYFVPLTVASAVFVHYRGKLPSRA
jgi:hypothetical protein